MTERVRGCGGKVGKVREFLPIAAGVCFGGVVSMVRSSWRLVVAVAASVAIGVVSTLASGEFWVSWSFLLIDIPGAALAICVGVLVASELRGATTRWHGQRHPRLPGRPRV